MSTDWSVEKAEKPQGHSVAAAGFDVVDCQIAVGKVFYLVERFPFLADLEQPAPRIFGFQDYGCLRLWGFDTFHDFAFPRGGGLGGVPGLRGVPSGGAVNPPRINRGMGRWLTWAGALASMGRWKDYHLTTNSTTDNKPHCLTTNHTIKQQTRASDDIVAAGFIAAAILDKALGDEG